MKTSMIPDDSIVEEMMTLDDDEDPTIDFAEGELIKLLHFKLWSVWLSD